MNFWDRVNNLLENKGITRKELAADARFDVSSIGKGKSSNLNSSPSADIAVRIAKVLGTNVEYLVTGSSTLHQENLSSLDDIYKYEHTIRKLSSIPEKQRMAIEHMIEDISSSYDGDESSHN